MRSCIYRIVTVAISIMTACASAATVTYKADCGPTTGPVAAGWTGPTANVPFHALSRPVFDFGGGVQLAFTSDVDNYSLANAANPVITDGLFVNSGTGPGTFEITGLTPGDKLTLYAIHAWDGNGAAAFVSLAGLPAVDTATADGIVWNSDPLPDYAADPQPQDMVLVAQDVVVGPSGSVSGYFSYTDGVTSRFEGQLGGLLFEVTSVPEPASSAMLIGGLAIVIRRRGRPAR